MIAIDLLSENLIEKFVEKKEIKKAYWLNGCSIYLTHEPCIMYTMALPHSRISTVFYLNKNPHSEALGSIYRLHTLKKPIIALMFIIYNKQMLMIWNKILIVLFVKWL